MSPSPAPEKAPAFRRADRAALRAAPASSRLGYIQRRLPEAIAVAVAELGLRATSRVLDFGCADQPYRALLPAGAEYLGADLPGNPAASITIGADGRLPLPEASVDAVLSTQVLEHVTDPAVYLAECHRVLKPGGVLLLSTHGIMVYHPDPDDYWRWTCAGLRRAVAQSGLVVRSQRGVMGLTATGLQLLQDGLFGRIHPRLRGMLTRIMQVLVRLADRAETDESRALNALVFVVVAEKPGPGPRITA